MKLYLTDKGREILYKAQGGQQLNFSKFVVGDGELGSQAIQTLTNVINPKMNLSISKINVKTDKVVIGTFLTNSALEEGFYFRELGLYANDPDTQEEVLYMYVNAGETAEYIDSKEGDIIEEYLDIIVVVSNVSEITASVDSSLVFVSAKEFEEHKTDSSSHITAEERTAWNNKAAGTDLTSHTGNTTSHITATERSTWNNKANATHNHSASDINAGTLESDRLPTIPITKGGTGATTAVQALKNLGINATAAQLNYMVGVTSAVQTQLNSKAPTANPTFTGTPKAPTAASGNNSTQLATTAFVQAALDKQLSEKIIADVSFSSAESFSLTGLSLASGKRYKLFVTLDDPDDKTSVTLKFNGVTSNYGYSISTICRAATAIYSQGYAVSNIPLTTTLVDAGDTYHGEIDFYIQGSNVSVMADGHYYSNKTGYSNTRDLVNGYNHSLGSSSITSILIDSSDIWTSARLKLVEV